MLTDKVYEKLKLVPAGKVTTYKLLAEACGVKAYRAVGQILKRNPYAPSVPCHRVIKSDGNIGGFMGKTQGKEVEKKIMMLKKEGIIIEGRKAKNLTDILFSFKTV